MVVSVTQQIFSQTPGGQRTGAPFFLARRGLGLLCSIPLYDWHSECSIKMRRVKHGTANDSYRDSASVGIGLITTNRGFESYLLGPEHACMKQLCNAPQPDHPMHRCVRFNQHTGPHQTFVAEWADGDVNSRRRPPRQLRADVPRAINSQPGGRRPSRSWSKSAR
jgi:hypothetical protein